MNKHLEKIRTLRFDLEEQEKFLLRDQGWTYSCDFPDSCWRWTKKLEDGRTLCMGEAQALQMCEDEIEREAVMDEIREKNNEEADL